MKMETRMVTDLNVLHHNFNWKISRFEDICPEMSAGFNDVKSENFTTNVDGMETKWYRWSVTVGGESESIKIYLYHVSDPELANYSKTVRCEFAICIGNDDNMEIVGKYFCDHEFKNGTGCGIGKFISIRELYAKRRTLLRDGCLCILVKMIVHGRPSTSVTVVPLDKANTSANTFDILSSNLGRIFNKKQNSDVEILCSGETFYAHKFILAARSAVFFAMFTSDLDRKSTTSIVVSGINSSVFRAILWYIYTGKAEINDMNSYIDLIHGAEKYDLSELKEHCFDLLCSAVTIETIGSLAVAADTYNADDNVKEFIKKYFLRNIDEVMKDPVAKSLVISNPKAFF